MNHWTAPPDLPRRPRTRRDPDADLADYLATWTTQKLRREHRQYKWMGKLSMVAIPACFLAGLWLDWRFLPTMLLPMVLFAMSVKGDKALHAELVNRENADAADTDEVCEGIFERLREGWVPVRSVYDATTGRWHKPGTDDTDDDPMTPEQFRAVWPEERSDA